METLRLQIRYSIGAAGFEDLKSRIRSLGFRLMELKRIDGQRFLTVGPGGLILRGHDEPLTAEDVVGFIERCEGQAAGPQGPSRGERKQGRPEVADAL